MTQNLGGKTRASAHQIELASEAESDLKALRSNDRKKIIEGVKTHLIHESTKPSRSRIEEMAQPFWCQYRLRIEDFRVYYDVDEEKQVVRILRILEKGSKSTPQEQNHEAN